MEERGLTFEVIIMMKSDGDDERDEFNFFSKNIPRHNLKRVKALAVLRLSFFFKFWNKRFI